MKTNLMILAVFLAIAFIHAQKSHPFDEHIKWLTENSEFEYNGEDYPDISYHSTEDLQIIAYSADRIEEAKNSGGNLPRIKALYDHRDNQLLFTKGMDITADETAYIVVHELIHFLQNINGITAQTDCIPSLEEPAYRLQAEWQREHDHPGPYPNFLFVKLLDLSCYR